MNQGWIKLHRSITDSTEYLSEPFTRTHAWIDLLLLASHKQSQFYIRGNLVIVGRGQVAWSERRLANRWCWSRNKLRRYLAELQKRGQVIPQKSKLITLLTITNYDIYQQDDTTESTTDDTTNDTTERPQKDQYKNVKNVKNEKNNTKLTKVNSDKSEKLQYGNKEINEILFALKKAIGIESFTDARIERMMARHCINLIGKITPQEFRRRLDVLLDDSFTRKNCNKIKFVYNNVKGFIEPKVIDNSITI